MCPSSHRTGKIAFKPASFLSAIAMLNMPGKIISVNGAAFQQHDSVSYLFPRKILPRKGILRGEEKAEFAGML